MGTNFCFMCTDKTFVDKYFSNECELTDTPYFGYEIHIGKRSFGWQPLFQAHEKAYSSVKTLLQFSAKHIDKLRIFDEYGQEFTLEELKHELIEWGREQPHTFWKYVPDGVPDEILGGKRHLIEGTADDYDLLGPFDHLDYDEFQKKKEGRHTGFGDSMLFRDKEGFNFLRGDFC